jgi:hypothetical protein
VDDKEVYSGSTPRSLGYVTLPLKPARGKSIRIELASATSRGDAFRMTELNSEQNASTGDDRGGNGTLAIVEFECFESPTGEK